MSGEVLAQTLVNGLSIGLVYALIAAGLSLIFGLMEIVNFAHGQFLMLSLYIAYWAYTLAGLDPLLSLPICALLLFALGLLTYHGIIRRALKGPMLAQIFATFGLGVFLQSLAQVLWSPNYRLIQEPVLKGRIAAFGIFIGLPHLAAGLGALLAFGLLAWFTTRTEMGIALQATSQDRDAAALMGINTNRMFALGWGIGLACVGVAGALLASFYYVFPEVGWTFALIAYVAVALGGFGSLLGSLIAGILIGLVEVFSGLFIAPAFKYLVVFVLYLAVVLVKPQGLMGRS